MSMKQKHLDEETKLITSYWGFVLPGSVSRNISERIHPEKVLLPFFRIFYNFILFDLILTHFILRFIVLLCCYL